jgi:hypothetical protein
MKNILLVLLLSLSAAAHAETALPPPDRTSESHDGKISFREQIKADRAKAAAELEAPGTARPWDKDVNGLRPWETKPELQIMPPTEGSRSR